MPYEDLKMEFVFDYRIFRDPTLLEFDLAVNKGLIN